jgi:hypothetical protein
VDSMVITVLIKSLIYTRHHQDRRTVLLTHNLRKLGRKCFDLRGWKEDHTLSVTSMLAPRSSRSATVSVQRFKLAPIRAVDPFCIN